MSPQLASSANAIADGMRAAYDRLSAELYDAARAAGLDRSDGEARLARFRRLASALLLDERDTLFPLLDHCGADRELLERDHRQLHDALDRAEAALARASLSDFSDVVQELMVILRAHCIRQARLFLGCVPELLDTVGPAPLDRVRQLFGL